MFQLAKSSKVCAIRAKTAPSTKVSARHFTVGQNVLDFKPKLKDSNGKELDAASYFKGKNVVIFGVPGAFTPVCSSRHVPDYVSKAEALKKAGIDTVACLSVNDKYVMKAWGDGLNTDAKVDMIADWDGSFTKFLGMDTDLGAGGLGVRAKRFSMVVKDGKVAWEAVETNPGEYSVSSPDKILEQLKK